MAQYLNKVQLIGRLGRDPEILTTSTGKSLAKMNIATTEYWNDNETGQRKDRTEWHTVVTWEKTAQFAKNYLAKGNLVYVEGSLRSREYTDQNGNKRKVFEINASSIILLQSEKRESRDFHKDDPQGDEFRDDINPEENTNDDDDIVPF